MPCRENRCALTCYHQAMKGGDSVERATYFLTLDVRKSGSQAQIRVKQGENISRKIMFTLSSGSNPLEYSREDAVILRAIKPDGTEVLDYCEVSGTAVTYLIKGQLIAVAGRVRCDLNVTGADGSVLYSPAFDIFVECDKFNGEIIESSNDFSALTEAISRVQSVWAAEEDRVEEEQLRRDAEEEREAAEEEREAAEERREKMLSSAGIVVSTLAPESAATASVSITEENGVQFELGIPRGLNGADGAAGKDGKDGKDGTDGRDGVSVSHRWSGTTLIVTSASGTSSVDLKGGKGDKGDDGAAGADGYSPVRGTDYWTNKDKREIVADVLAALPSAEGVDF